MTPEEPDDSDWTEAATDVYDREAHALRLLSERCPTCILGGPDSIARTLRPGRVAQMVRDAADGYIPCHTTLSNSKPHAAICRGWYDSNGHRSNAIRVMQRLGAITEVDLEK